MKSREAVLQSIFNAVDEVNKVSPPEQQIAKSAGTVLIGEASNLDSLGLASLSLAVQQCVEKDFGDKINLVNLTTLSLLNSPFRTVGTLADYICSLLQNES